MLFAQDRRREERIRSDSPRTGDASSHLLYWSTFPVLRLTKDMAPGMIGMGESGDILLATNDSDGCSFGIFCPSERRWHLPQHRAQVVKIVPPNTLVPIMAFVNGDKVFPESYHACFFRIEDLFSPVRSASNIVDLMKSAQWKQIWARSQA